MIEQGRDDCERGLQILIAMGTVGRQMTAALTAGPGGLDLAGNIPVQVVCDMAFRAPLRPRDLQAATGLTSGGMTKQLDRLEPTGLVDRAYREVADDRRAIVISLPSKGERTAVVMSATASGRTADLRDLAARLADLSSPEP